MTDKTQTPLEIAIDRLVRTNEFLHHKTGCSGWTRAMGKCNCGLGELRVAILEGTAAMRFELAIERDSRIRLDAEVTRLRNIPNADEWAERIDRDTGCGPVARARIADALRAMYALGEAGNGD